MGYALTTIDVSALRKADKIYFQTDWPADGSPERGVINAIKENKKTASDPWADEVKHSIDCNSLLDARQGWAGKHDGCKFEPRLASESNSSAQYWGEWQTAASLLRPGNTLTLLWDHNSGSEEQQLAGFTTDRLTLIVDRPAKGRGKERRLMFLLMQHSTRSFPYVRGRWIPREAA